MGENGESAIKHITRVNNKSGADRLHPIDPLLTVSLQMNGGFPGEETYWARPEKREIMHAIEKVFIVKWYLKWIYELLLHQLDHESLTETRTDRSTFHP